MDRHHQQRLRHDIELVHCLRFHRRATRIWRPSREHQLRHHHHPTNEAVFNFPSTTLAIGAATGNVRGLVIGSGVANGYAKLRISAGTISTEAATTVSTNAYADIIGNTGGNAFFELDGGNYASGATGLYIGFNGSTNSTFTISSASSTATISSVLLNAAPATVNLNAGTLAVNTISRAGGTANFNFNGGTLKARQASTSFLSGMTTQASTPPAPSIPTALMSPSPVCSAEAAAWRKTTVAP